MTTLDELLNSGASGFFSKDSKVGDTVTGALLSADIKQATDYVTKALKFWDDGRPQNQVVLRLQTDLRNPDDEFDTGVRAVYVKTWGDNWRAFRAAMRGVDLKTQLGGQMTVTLSGTKPSQKGSDEKLYTFDYVAPAAEDATPSSSAAETPTSGVSGSTTNGVNPSPEAMAALAAYLKSAGK